MDQDPKIQLVERIKSSTNILVTVSANPTVDQLAACIGFTLLLNKLGKHATAVFSGQVPSTIEFLQPADTLETNTDSLQDFIIALDKSKADKLRYKVEDEVVRIFITPYRTSISQKDLDFSQGDFNVDMVVGLGIIQKEDIDQAIVTNGRILHDAVVMTVTSGETTSTVGSVDWHDPTASSLSEMLVSVSDSLQGGLLDAQISTAFLTGIVAQTDRFSNEKTTPKVMTMSAQLMAAGANQQLIANKLDPEPEPIPTEPVQVDQTPATEPAPEPVAEPPVEPPKADGEIDIDHSAEEAAIAAELAAAEKAAYDELHKDEIQIDDQGNLEREAERQAAEKAALEAEGRPEETPLSSDPGMTSPGLMPASPTAADGTPAADFIARNQKKVVEPLPGTSVDTLQEPSSVASETPSQISDLTVPSEPAGTLAELEESVGSPHAAASPDQTVDQAREAVGIAGLDVPPRPQAMQSLGAQPFELGTPTPPVAPAPDSAPMTGVADIVGETSSAPAETSDVTEDPLAPPPVPPPMTVPFFEPTTSHHNPYLNPEEKPADPSASEDSPAM